MYLLIAEAAEKLPTTWLDTVQWVTWLIFLGWLVHKVYMVYEK